MVNVIVRPDVYERHRVAIRGEPFLWVSGKLAKDDGTVNVIAEEARGLRLHGMRDAGSEVRDATDDHSSPISHPASRPYSFLKTMRRVAPDSKDWG